jgi:hypothetical protein
MKTPARAKKPQTQAWCRKFAHQEAVAGHIGNRIMSASRKPKGAAANIPFHSPFIALFPNPS